MKFIIIKLKQGKILLEDFAERNNYRSIYMYHVSIYIRTLAYRIFITNVVVYMLRWLTDYWLLWSLSLRFTFQAHGTIFICHEKIFSLYTLYVENLLYPFPPNRIRKLQRACPLYVVAANFIFFHFFFSIDARFLNLIGLYWYSFSFARATKILAEMRSTFGSNDCRMLCINSSEDELDHYGNLWNPYVS